MKFIKLFLLSFCAIISLSSAEQMDTTKQKESIASFISPLFNKPPFENSDKKLLSIIQLIAKRDIEGLKACSADDLTFGTDAVVWVDGEHYSLINNEKAIQQVCYTGTNALPFVLLHSSLNQSEQDDKTTLAMLDMLLDKGLDLSAKWTYTIWVDDKDYVVPPASLVEVALMVNFPEALIKLLEKGAHFDARLIDIARERGYINSADLLECYIDQIDTSHDVF